MAASRYNYDRFKSWLEATTRDFHEVEGIIGCSLTPSAYTHNAWWSNSYSHPLARRWLEAGWLVPREGLNWGREEITLIRDPSSSETARRSPEEPRGSLKAAHMPAEVTVELPKDWHDVIAGETSFPIVPVRGAGGQIEALRPQDGVGKQSAHAFHAYGNKQFCAFSVPDDIHAPASTSSSSEMSLRTSESAATSQGDSTTATATSRRGTAMRAARRRTAASTTWCSTMPGQNGRLRSTSSRSRPTARR